MMQALAGRIVRQIASLFVVRQRNDQVGRLRDCAAIRAAGTTTVVQAAVALLGAAAAVALHLLTAAQSIIQVVLSIGRMMIRVIRVLIQINIVIYILVAVLVLLATRAGRVRVLVGMFVLLIIVVRLERGVKICTLFRLFTASIRLVRSAAGLAAARLVASQLVGAQLAVLFGRACCRIIQIHRIRPERLFLDHTVRVAVRRSGEQLRLSQKRYEYVFELAEIDLFVCEMNGESKGLIKHAAWN